MRCVWIIWTWLFLVVMPVGLAANEGAGDTLSLETLELRFQPGDDIAWAQPDFDDSDWKVIALPHRWHHTATGSDRGWYRFRVARERLQQHGQALDLGILGYLAEVYMDGVKVGENGVLEHHLGPTEFQPDVFPLPAARDTDAAEVVFALRVASLWGKGGLLKGPWLLAPAGERLQIASQRGLARWLVIIALEVVLLFWAFLFFLLLLKRQNTRLAGWGLAFFLALAAFWASFYVTADALGIAWEAATVEGMRIGGQLAFSAALLTAPFFLAAVLGARLPRLVLWLLVALVSGASLVDALTLIWPDFVPGGTLGFFLALIRIGSLLLVAGASGWMLVQGVRRGVPGAKSLGVGCGFLAAAYAVDIMAYLWPMPLYLASWLPLGTSRAALLYFGEVGLFVLAFTVGQAVLAQYLAREQLIARLGESLAQSRQSERDHLSRELHDGVQPQIAALRLVLQRTGKEPAAAAAMAKAMTMVDELQGELRAALHGLRVPWLENRSLEEALARLVKELGAVHQVVITDKLSDAATLPPHLEDAVFRFLQEALANALRHAEAQKIVLSLETTRDFWQFSCRDDGKGMVVPGRAKGYGLVTMQERAELLGGMFSIDSRPNHGTVVTWQQPRQANNPASG